MGKKLFLFAAAAVALASCTETDLSGDTSFAKESTSDAIQFSATTRNTGTTRAGATGTITTENLKTTAGAIREAGFGVYALYTGDTNFDEVVDRTPNFMWNQQVKSDGTKWNYTPVKYWPNGNTTADNTYNNATGTGGGKVSFFAYAPYVSAGADEAGITAVSANDVKTNPYVSYRLTEGESFVDLLWGSTNGSSETTYDAAQAGGTVVSTSNGTNITTPINPVAAGKTNINLTKQKIKEGTVNFFFKHALSKIGGGTARANGTPAGISIMLDIDDLNGGTDDANTKVLVKEIKITTDADGDGTVEEGEKVYNDGTLDLATGLWSLPTKSADKVVSMTTSRTADSYYELNSTIMEPSSAPAKTEEAWTALPEGVKVTPKSIYKKTDVEGLVFFPGEAPKLRVTVDYIVRTKDTGLANSYSEVEQTVTKVLQMPTLKMNKVYNLLIHLGLTSVKFTASVADWSDDNNDGTVDPATEIVLKEVWVPANVLAVAAGSTATVNISKTEDSKFQFEVTGLGDSEAWTAESSNTEVATVTASGTSDANGKATIEVTTKKNTGAARTTTITITKTSDSSTTTLTVNQAAGN
ncbi:MAG: hypothetical protein IKP84_04100 [Prevotella sp.]|nr:hypothetical protein [Prevotella sp.]